jgi:lipopolysaccharide/colanic/teichoic acid biosynthesis glycosyltransferase
VAEAIEHTQPDQIFVLAIEPPTGAVRELMAQAHKAGCNVYLYNDYAERLGIPLQPVSFDGQPFLVIGDEPLEDPFNRTLKRTLDLVLTIPLLVLLPPIALAVAFGQKLQSQGPLLFRQKRSGLRGHNFTILKFRTMDTTGGRIYPLGAFLRRTSLDELPQLFNVLRGDMSLVGPRPHIVKDDVTFSEQAEIYRMRFFAKPGITGLAQSRGFRGEVFEPKLIQERLELDLLYIRSWSLWLDIAIMARTIREVFVPPPSAK